MNLGEEAKKARKPEHEIHPIFIKRWSPRAMTGEEMSDAELMPLFEAAKWAPSASNSQVWRFVYAKRGTKHWKKFLNLLAEGNKKWAKNASVLVVIVSRKNMEYKEKPSRTHSFDTGASWVCMALEGARRNLVVHGMAGFDYEKAAEAIGLQEPYTVEAMAAIGKYGKKEELPMELRERETPSQRKKLAEIVFEGKLDSE